MKRSSFLSIAFTGLLATATAQTHEQPEWNDLNISGVNKETACQTAIPFADEGQALRLSIEELPLLSNSERYMEIPLGGRSRKTAEGFLQARLRRKWLG